MKKWIGKFLSIALLAATMAACTNNSSDDSPSNGVDDTLTSAGTWKVVYYWDKDKEETSDFAGYIFSFEQGGVFKSTKGGVTTTGTWQVNSSSNKLIINSGSGLKPLDDLSDDWIIDQKTDKLIKLKDDNDEHDEFLHFAVI